MTIELPTGPLAPAPPGAVETQMRVALLGEQELPKRGRMRLLVVDWDYFFPAIERPSDGPEWTFYDWGHDEGHAAYFETIWPYRAATFLAAGLELPGTSDALAGFWDRFKFGPHTQLFYCDQNMYAANARVHTGVGEAWLFDAHHDSGYEEGERGRVIIQQHVTSASWMIAFELAGIELHMRYPLWRHYGLEVEPEPPFTLDRAVDDEGPVEGTFDRVFVCRSPAWVPPWLDAQFFEFIERAPVNRTIPLHQMGLRQFELSDVEALAAQVKALVQHGNDEVG